METLINRQEHVVTEMIDGMVALYPGLARLADYSIVLSSDAGIVADEQVALISGGGSGHEPAHAGYVGGGMLSAAVAGEVFTSPSPDAVLAAITAVAGKRGVLLIVKNYTGDRLNFGLAAEMARAQHIPVETVLVADDAALAENQERLARRGIAGTVLVHKIAGAAAAEGRSLAEVAGLARAIAEDVTTMGVSLSAGTAPAVGKPSFLLGENEIELGLGIHGEPGVKRTALRPADELVDTLLSTILSAHPLGTGERVAVLVNNLGATTVMELAIIGRRTFSRLQSQGFIVERMYAGTFLSALDTAGISLSVLPVDEERLRLLDAPTSAPAWPSAPAQRRSECKLVPVSNPVCERTDLPAGSMLADTRLTTSIRNACKALISAENYLTELDLHTGDGDLGVNMARAARKIESELAGYGAQSPPDILKRIGWTLQRVLGGSSGPLYGVFFIRAGAAIETAKAKEPMAYVDACLAGCQAISELGGASAGDRTMLDALLPFAQTLRSRLAAGVRFERAIADALGAAGRGAESTAQMLPRRGRSSYLGDRVVGYSDPGAMAAAIWLRAALEWLSPGA
ncbi:MAG: dihydroxyacetone kinase subunit DhaK [Acidobacteriaceae bacterium]|nr:dihydroxyacetone kinase subunit DhaK [Acidobacteriaceae bacterium]